MRLHLYRYQAGEGQNSGQNHGTIRMILEQISTTTESVFILLDVPVVLRSFKLKNKCRRSKNVRKNFRNNFAKNFENDLRTDFNNNRVRVHPA